MEISALHTVCELNKNWIEFLHLGIKGFILGKEIAQMIFHNLSMDK